MRLSLSLAADQQYTFSDSPDCAAIRLSSFISRRTQQHKLRPMCRCLRMADAAAQQNMSALYFGDACTAPQDMQAVQAFFQSEGLALAQSMFAEAQAAQQVLRASSAPQPHVQHFRRPPKPPDWWVKFICATEHEQYASAISDSLCASCLLRVSSKLSTCERASGCFSKDVLGLQNLPCNAGRQVPGQPSIGSACSSSSILMSPRNYVMNQLTSC